MAITPTSTWYQGRTGGAPVNGFRGPITSNLSGNPPFQGYAPKYTGMKTGGASGESMANAGQTKPAVPATPVPAPSVPLTAQQVEMQGIERAAKARMAQANSQSDMNRAAMLQDVNEKAFSQGIDPSSNAAWSMKQRATDQAGIQGNQIQNQALDLNTQAMLNEQDQITQRANQEADIQSNRDWMTTEKASDRAYQEKNTASDRAYQEKNTASDRAYQTGIDQLNAARNQASNILENPSNYNSETVAWANKIFAESVGGNAEGLDIADVSKRVDPSTQASRSRLQTAGLETSPENIALISAALDNGDEESVIRRLKAGESLTLETYNAANSVVNDVIRDPSKVSSLTAQDWGSMSESQLDAVAKKMGTSGMAQSWPTQVNKGTVLMNNSIPYKVAYDPKGSSGKYVQDMSGNFFFINYKGDVTPTTMQNMGNYYAKKHDVNFATAMDRLGFPLS